MSNGHNPFNDRLDWLLQGKYCRIHTSHRVYEGWVEMVHHQRGSLVVHDGMVQDRLEDHELSEARAIDGVFIRSPEQVEVLKRGKRIEAVPLAKIVEYEDHPLDFDPVDAHMRQCYRNGFAGSFPVVRQIQETVSQHEVVEKFQIINGHKRIEAARTVGLDSHPCEVIQCSDEEARELFRLAHRDEIQKKDMFEWVSDRMNGGEDDGTD